MALPDLGNASRRDADARLAEAAGLAEAIGVKVVEKLHFKIRSPRPATLFGTGQTEAIAAAAAANEAELLVVDAAITPIQQKNLETATEAKVIDRTGLILEIFGERAATAEGRLQVELAHLDYQAGRLVRSWTHLERQRGGFGFLGGPGETQIEADRRLIRDRMAKLRKELDQVTRTRALHRARRQRAPWPVIALVGYTNAGKSTLFNRLTGAAVVAEDQLFATLDPTLRAMQLPSGRRVILSDTVGFISELPTELVAAFRATLEEVAEADVILHVRDAAHPDGQAQRADVLSVLDGMAEEGTLDPAWRARTLEVPNKADLLGGVANLRGRSGEAAVSALTGEGLSALLDTLDERLAGGLETARYGIPASDGARLAWLYAHGEVVGREDADEMVNLTVRLRPADRGRFERGPPRAAAA